MMLTTVFLTGFLAVQEPQKPQPTRPQDPPRSGEARDPAKGSVQVDAELRAALEELRRSTGYRFDIDGSCSMSANRPLAGGADSKNPDPNRDEKGDKAGQGDDKVAHAKEHAGKPESFHVTGAFQREKPVQIKTDKIEAFRSTTTLVWRSRDSKEWSTLPAHVGEPPKADASKSDATDGDEKNRGDKENAPKGGAAGAGDDLRTAGMLASLPLPDDLIRDIDARLVSCQRASGAEAKAGTATYECVICPTLDEKDTRRNDGARGDAQRADAHGDAKSDGKNCAVRFIVAQGKIAEIEWRHPADSKPQAAGGQNITCHYKLSDLGSTQVTVPEDAARVLGSR